MPQPTPQETLARGTILDNRYRIDRVIGSGGYASVYRALDTNYNVERAIKEVTDPDKGVREQFRLEADLLINHNHPNIPRGYKVFEMNKRIYFVMDFVQGKDLEELLNESLTQQRRPLDEARVLRWAVEICGALSELHRMQTPIIHRDIKPANIKITPQERPMLIDFGLAKLQQSTPVATQAAAQGVSPGFAPPEQYMARGRTDARTDIYGLGATLYACLTGRDPAEAPARLLAQTGVAHGSQLIPPRSHNPRISQRTEEVILKALELSPSKRQQSATELETELRDALNRLSGAGAPATAVMPQAGAPRGASGRPAMDQASAKRAVPPVAQKPAVAAAVQQNRQPLQKGLGRSPIAPAATIDPRTSKQPVAPDAGSGKQPVVAADPRTGKHAVGPLAAVASVAAAAPVVGAALNRAFSGGPAAVETGQHRTLAAAQPSASRSSGKHPAVGATAQQPVVSTTSSNQPLLHLKNGPAKNVAASAVAVAAAAGGGKALSAVAVPEKEKSGKANRASAKHAAVATPASAPASAAAAAGAVAVDPRAMVKMGSIPISSFGKWALTFSVIEALWGAVALSLGVLSLMTHGLTTSLLLKLGLGWLVVVAILSLYGGQALGRPIYRRGKLGGVRRSMQGTGLFFFSVLVHLVAVWGASIFIAAPGNEPLAVIAYIFFGLNVLAAGVLSVFNILG